MAVINGGGGIICAQVAKDLAKLGITVVLVGRTMGKLQKVARQIQKAGGRCACYVCDVVDQAAVNALSEEVIACFGHCDYLINGAGGNNAKAQPNIAAFDPMELSEDRPEELRGLYNVDMEGFESVLRINTMCTVYPTLSFARFTAGRGGSIVNFASMNTYCPLTRNFAYAMSKAAIANLTQALAAYFANAGIRVNAVALGFIVNERSKLMIGDSTAPYGVWPPFCEKTDALFEFPPGIQNLDRESAQQYNRGARGPPAIYLTLEKNGRRLYNQRR